jgi:C4-dicarboxylate-specific signal transduction histidine kinase
MEQVFINILTNSIESLSSKGEIVIVVSKDENAKSVLIDFRDNGTGIPDEIMNNIFDPFFTTKQNGVGLGLSIAYEVIKAHKGKIVFTQLQPTGTSCKIELRIAQ